MLRKLESEDMDRTAAVHRVSFDEALPSLEGFAHRIWRNIRTMLSKKALTIGFTVEKAGFGWCLWPGRCGRHGLFVSCQIYDSCACMYCNRNHCAMRRPRLA
jgi:hypothetical protein